jgi:hypothetical protein
MRQGKNICERFHRTIKQEFFDITFRGTPNPRGLPRGASQRKSTTPSKNCKQTLTCGSINTINKDHTVENIATVKHPCKPSAKHNTSQWKKPSLHHSYRTAISLPDK